MHIWATNASTTLEAMVNPVIAACDRGFVPDRIAIVTNPSVTATVDRAAAIMTAACVAYDDTEPTIDRHPLEAETDFTAIAAAHRQILTDAPSDATVAVDITPGRKYMGAIAFAAGFRHAADHVYYLLLRSEAHYGKLYPEIPRPAVALIDLLEAA